MPVLALSELSGHLAKSARLLGLDLGERTIGLAISDLGFMVASPLETIRRGKFTRDAEALMRMQILPQDRVYHRGNLSFLRTREASPGRAASSTGFPPPDYGTRGQAPRE